MRSIPSNEAWEGCPFWRQTDEVFRRVNDLIKNTKRTAFQGTGKPEPLRGDLSGCWSRRIAREHRMACRASEKGKGKAQEISDLRFHCGSSDRFREHIVCANWLDVGTTRP
ncbi:MAG: Txe/YoeB family addiction module toxin [Boseongicola sp. SB0662_bin_57]|nr:Txe/YoeB family addiction module toxin [Boseongicola sp. SB0662_bin_57]